MNRSKSGHSDLSRFTIKTPEGIVFSLDLASPVSRCMAWLIDLFTILVLLIVTYKIVRFFFSFSHDMVNAIMTMVYFILSIAYSIALEWYLRGQTLGKRMLGLRVMDGQGLRLRFSQIVIRNLLRAVDNLPACYMVGGLCSLLTQKCQRLGDLAANTIVIAHFRQNEPDLKQVLSDKYNSLRDYPHLVARARQRISPVESGILLQALLRREELRPDCRVDLYKTLSEFVKSAIAFPPEAVMGLSDEQYLRNIIDILFRQ